MASCCLKGLPVLQGLQIVEGDFVVENNPKLTSLAGTSQSLTTVLGQVQSALAIC